MGGVTPVMLQKSSAGQNYSAAPGGVSPGAGAGAGAGRDPSSPGSGGAGDKVLIVCAWPLCIQPPYNFPQLTHNLPNHYCIFIFMFCSMLLN